MLISSIIVLLIASMNYAIGELMSNLRNIYFSNVSYIFPKRQLLKEKITNFEISLLDKLNDIQNLCILIFNATIEIFYL